MTVLDPDDPGSWEPTNEAIIEHLTHFVCDLAEPWAGPEYHTAHGHTDCLFIGYAIKRLKENS